MSYVGDFRLGDTFDVKFTTRRFTTGAPFTLAGTPAVAAYPGNSTTEVTAGITLTVDFDSRTGLHNVRVVASSGNGYATATNYALVITAGTVDSVSVVGEVIGHFSIENRSALMPTTAARTLDVSAGGEAGVDWANVGSPTSTVNLSGTSVATATAVETDTQDIQNRLPAALVGGRIDANAGAISADATAADNLEAALDGTGGVTITAAVTGNITGNLSGSVGSVTGNLGGNVVGSVGSVTAAVTVGTNNDKTGYRLDATGSAALTEGYAADGAAGTLPQLLYMILALLSDFAISGTTLTARRLDGTTTAGTFTLDSDTNPTSITRAS